MAIRLRPGPRSAVLICIALLCAFEILLGSLGGYGRFAATEASERLGWRKIPNQHVVGPRGVQVRINSQGYRDRDWPAASEEKHGLRVILLGDSVTYAPHEVVEDGFGRRLEAGLQRALGERPVTVMNMSVPGYVFEQMARVYDDDAQPYEPDLLILALGLYATRPMPPASDPNEYPGRRFMARTAIRDWYVRTLLPLVRPEEEEASGLGASDSSQAYLNYLSETHAISDDPFGPVAEHYRHAARERLIAMRDQLVANGGRLIILSLPDSRQLFGTEDCKVAERWHDLAAAEVGIEHISVLAEFRDAAATLVADLELQGATYDVLFSRYNEPHPEFVGRKDVLFRLNDDGHFTIAGHELMGRLLTEKILAGGR